MRPGREDGGEGVAGKAGDVALMGVNAANERAKDVAHDAGQHFCAVLAVAHQGAGDGGEAGDVHKHGRGRKPAGAQTQGVLFRDEVGDQVVHVALDEWGCWRGEGTGSCAIGGKADEGGVDQIDEGGGRQGWGPGRVLAGELAV